jgi:hypothetical protein
LLRSIPIGVGLDAFLPRRPDPAETHGETFAGEGNLPELLTAAPDELEIAGAVLMADFVKVVVSEGCFLDTPGLWADVVEETLAVV